MKKIAVLIHSLTIEYSLDILTGILQFFEDKDVSLVIAQTKSPYAPLGLYEYQYWSNTIFVNNDQIDAYIVITGSYLSHISVEVLSKHLEKFGNKPIVSIAIPLDLPNCGCIRTECESAYEEIVEHLKNKHGCKNFAFMSANGTNSPEAFIRFEAYKKALKNNGLQFNEDFVFDGLFRRVYSEEVILNTFKSKDEIKFDVLVCANDLMALGAQSALQKLGVKIPEEVKIFGFDETIQATNVSPKISTVDQNIIHQGYLGAEMLLDMLKGNKKIHDTVLKTIPLYRQSCGCIPLSNMENVYLDNKNTILHISEAKQKLLSQTSNYFNFLTGIDNIYSLFDLSTSAMTLRKTFYAMKNMLPNAELNSLAVFFFEKPVSVEKNQEIVLPETVRVSMFFDKESETEMYEPGIVFNYKDYLIPTSLFGDIKANYLIQPIFSGETVYGYILCNPNGKTFPIYSIYMKIIINALAQAYEYTETLFRNQKLEEENLKLQQNNQNLNNASKTDELTKILNRRGFIDLGQKALDIAKDMDTSGLVIFFDMDGLKVINDTYGHEMGDKAIVSMANVIKSALRSNDVVGRIGGDEFAAVAAGIKMNQSRVLRRRIKKLCEQETRKNKYPFNLSCSAGITEFNHNNTNLTELLSSSDTLLYKEKRLKHSKNK